MISITINASSGHELREMIRGILGDDPRTPGETVEAPPQEKPKATRSTKAKTEDAKPVTVEAGEPEQVSGEDETSSTSTTATPAASPSEPVTAASLRARATAYAAKGGPAALIEMQKLAGAPEGKMSEIVTSPDAMSKLDILLSDAGF